MAKKAQKYKFNIDMLDSKVQETPVLNQPDTRVPLA